jgi:hypothetical protein
MRHFAVVLVMEDAIRETDPELIRERVEKEMAPFMENCCAEPDKMYMKFYDEEDEMLKQYEEGTREMIVMPDGRLLLPWDDEFKVKDAKDPLGLMGRPEPPKELERRQVPFKDTFSTFGEYAKEWHGKSERDEIYKRYGYWQNPNAKWDWYEIGGRWAGFYQLKPGREGAMGAQYNFTEELTHTNGGKADVCFKSAIDFTRMRDEAEESAAKVYDKVQEAIKDLPVADSWEMVKAEFDFNKAPQDIEVARKVYHDQPRVKAFRKLGPDIVGWMVGVEQYQIPRKQYLKNARNDTAVPFAVLKDGKWYESGSMGWFGYASNEKDPETWSAMVNKLMDDLPEDTLLVVCDCHI